MNNWRKSSTREASKTKAELRQMLTDAVRNTPGPDQGRKRLATAEEIAAAELSVD
jgi:hypothetical protein